MRRLLFYFMACIFCLSAFAGHVSEHPENLRSLKTADIRVIAYNIVPEDIWSQEAHDKLKDNIRSIYQEAGIRHDVNSNLTIDCEINLHRVQETIVASGRVDVYDYKPDGSQYSSLFSISNQPFVLMNEEISDDSIASLCTERFLEFWIEFNPSLPPSRRSDS